MNWHFAKFIFEIAIFCCENFVSSLEIKRADLFECVNPSKICAIKAVIPKVYRNEPWLFPLFN